VAILNQNAPKCVWWPGSARTRWGSLSAPPDPLAVNRGRGRVRKGREGRGRGGKEGKGREREGGKGGGKGKGREREGICPPNVGSRSTPLPTHNKWDWTWHIMLRQ